MDQDPIFVLGADRIVVGLIAQEVASGLECDGLAVGMEFFWLHFEFSGTEDGSDDPDPPSRLEVNVTLIDECAHLFVRLANRAARDPNCHRDDQKNDQKYDFPCRSHPKSIAVLAALAGLQKLPRPVSPKERERRGPHILKLVVEGRFPKLWTPDREQRDLRQLVLHRHKLVEIRSRVKNELQHLSMNKGMQKKRTLWSQAGQKMLRELPLKAWASCRREDLLGLLGMLNQQVGRLDGAVQKAAEEHPQARLLMTQPGVGPNTALAFVLTIGDVSRFPRGKQVASYLGLIPREESSGGRQKLGALHIC